MWNTVEINLLLSHVVLLILLIKNVVLFALEHVVC